VPGGSAIGFIPGMPQKLWGDVELKESIFFLDMLSCHTIYCDELTN
jgi:hypothetical protein